MCGRRDRGPSPRAYRAALERRYELYADSGRNADDSRRLARVIRQVDRRSGKDGDAATRMTTWIEPPPPQARMGCFAKGCLILIAFFVLLGLAFIGGTFFAVRYLRTAYFPTMHVQLPATAATEQEQQLVRARWDSFEKAARTHQPARIEMTADDLNALIASEPKLRGKAYVSIDKNVGRLQVSIPLDAVRWLRGHYINAECAVQSAV